MLFRSITVQRSTSSLMTAVAISVTGCDASGTVANAFTQTKQTSSYTSTPTLTFDTTVTDTTVHFYGLNSGGTTTTVENTNLVEIAGNYNSTRLVGAYAASGDDTPSTTNSGGQYSAIIAGELKEAAAGGANPKGPLGMPIRGPFGGPI